MFALMLLGGANEVSRDAPASGQEEANSQTAGGQIVPEQRTHTSRLGRQSRAKSKLTQCSSNASQTHLTVLALDRSQLGELPC
jgi:hypothetical protein